MLLMDELLEGYRGIAANGSVQFREAEAALLRASYSQVDADRLARKGAQEMVDALTSAARFRLTEAATRAVHELVESSGPRLAVSAPHLFMPAETCWFETWASNPEHRLGCIAKCDPGSLQKGFVTAFMWSTRLRRPTGLECDFDLTDPRNIASISEGDMKWSSMVRQYTQGSDHDLPGDIVRTGQVLLGVLAFLCSPKLHTTRVVETAKINKHRVAKGKWPLLTYKEVGIDLRSPHAKGAAPATGSGQPRALHFVRAHLRLWTSGQVVLVRPHWRGDGQLGIKRPAYRLHT